MKKWEKLNQEFDSIFDNITKKQWVDWYENKDMYAQKSLDKLRHKAEILSFKHYVNIIETLYTAPKFDLTTDWNFVEFISPNTRKSCQISHEELFQKPRFQENIPVARIMDTFYNYFTNYYSYNDINTQCSARFYGLKNEITHPPPPDIENNENKTPLGLKPSGFLFRFVHYGDQTCLI